MDKLLTIKPTSWWCYIVLVFLGALFVRLFMSTWRNFDSENSSKKRFYAIFWGIGYIVKDKDSERRVAADYWLGFIIGMVELLSYPVLFLSNHANFIGAWLAFKTVNRWGYAPGYNRGHFNRYLVANALILIISFILAKYMF